ncbi:MAG: S41 family peptidase [Muribaculaceae bacterium]|nr:S41 family peptidase [Muribaculaceae bacterium]
MQKNYSKLTIFTPVIIAVAFIGGFLCSRFVQLNPGQSAVERKFLNILKLIEAEYVDQIDIDSLLEASIPSIFGNLDPHSVYIPASDLQAVNEELEGSFTGVGILFSIQNDTILVTEALSNGPSERVGIKNGDRIIAVDGRDVTGPDITFDTVRSLLRGPKGTNVDLTVKRYNARKPLQFTVTRDDVTSTSIDAAFLVNDTTGFIRVNRFASSTYNEFWDALNNLRVNGAKDYIIDLRSNTGGFMEMAILMVNEFLQRGTPIVFTRGRDTRTDEYVVADGTGAYQDSRIVVLIDEISASSSEIFAGAIQDNDRGLVIGRRSFGKGLVQTQLDLPDGSAMRLTIKRYYTPSGRCIQKDYSDLESYENDLLNRYNHGEAFELDSIKINSSEKFNTLHGRTVYGGGGIMPDIFVPHDTTAFKAPYYSTIYNSGLLQKYALEFCDMNREALENAQTVAELESQLPSDNTLLKSFTSFAAKNNVPTRWYYVDLFGNLIVNQLKALIARDIIGLDAYYEIINRQDPTVVEALNHLNSGEADFPVTLSTHSSQKK